MQRTYRKCFEIAGHMTAIVDAYNISNDRTLNDRTSIQTYKDKRQ
jgi:hypothetical protein